MIRIGMQPEAYAFCLLVSCVYVAFRDSSFSKPLYSKQQETDLILEGFALHIFDAYPHLLQRNLQILLANIPCFRCLANINLNSVYSSSFPMHCATAAAWELDVTNQGYQVKKAITGTLC